MKTELMAFLKAVEEQVPHKPKTQPALVTGRYGSDELGWEDRLVLLVTPKGSNIPMNVFLDDEDFNKSPTEFAVDVASLCSGARIGVAKVDGERRIPTQGSVCRRADS